MQNKSRCKCKNNYATMLLGDIKKLGEQFMFYETFFESNKKNV